MVTLTNIQNTPTTSIPAIQAAANHWPAVRATTLIAPMTVHQKLKDPLLPVYRLWFGPIGISLANSTDAVRVAGQAVIVSDDSGYETPEACALAGWTPEWQAQVIEIEHSPDMAYVLVDTEPSHPMMVTCGRRDGRWYEVASSSANLPWRMAGRQRGRWLSAWRAAASAGGRRRPRSGGVRGL